MTWALWSSLFLISLLGAMSPGPSLAMVLKHSLSGGRVHGFVCAWSHAFGIGIYALLTLFGLAVLVKEFPDAFRVVNYLGAVYLAWLGWQAIRSKSGIAERLKTGQAAPLIQASKDGFLISILNPKIALFFAALFSQFIDPNAQGVSQVIIVVTPFFVDGLWYSLVAFLLSSPFLFQRLKQHAHWFDRVSGVIFILLAIRVIWSA